MDDADKDVPAEIVRAEQRVRARGAQRRRDEFERIGRKQYRAEQAGQHEQRENDQAEQSGAVGAEQPYRFPPFDFRL